MVRSTWSLVGLAFFTLSCSGEEFASQSSGGAAGAGAVAGSGGSAAGAGGVAAGGTSGGGGSGGSVSGGSGGTATGGSGGTATGGSGGTATGGSGGTAAGGSGGTATGGSGGTATGGSGGTVTGGSGGTVTGGSGGTAAGGSGGTGIGGSGGATMPPWADCGKLNSPTPLLYSTLDDMVAIVAPAVGVGPGSAVPGDAFQTAKCAHGIALDAVNERVEFPLSGNIDFNKGTIDFWYVPKASETDGAVHNLFATSGFSVAGEGGIKIRKSSSSNSNELAAYFTDPAGGLFKTAIAEADYSFTPNTPVRITVAWSLSGPAGSPAMRIFLDKVEPTKYAVRAKLPISTPIGNVGGKIFVGAEKASDTTPANGLVDDFKIYGATLQPN